MERIPLEVPLTFDDLEIVVAAAYQAPFGFAIWQGNRYEPQKTDLTLKFINLAGASPTGKPPAELVNQPMPVALPEVVGTALETAIREVLKSGSETQVLVRTAQPGERVRTFRNKIASISEGIVLATYEEITDQVLMERDYKIERRTKLATRAYFDDVFGELVQEHQSQDGHIGMLFIDLDKFKEINDTYGHICGDETLAAVAARLRMLDPQPRLIARWGGDEFALLTRWSAEKNRELAAEILDAFKEPILWGKERIQVNLSIGLATSTGEAVVNPRAFLVAVDQAMYQAKRKGGHVFVEVVPEQL